MPVLNPESIDSARYHRISKTIGGHGFGARIWVQTIGGGTDWILGEGHGPLGGARIWGTDPDLGQGHGFWGTDPDFGQGHGFGVTGARIRGTDWGHGLVGGTD